LFWKVQYKNIDFKPFISILENIASDLKRGVFFGEMGKNFSEKAGYGRKKRPFSKKAFFGVVFI